MKTHFKAMLLFLVLFIAFSVCFSALADTAYAEITLSNNSIKAGETFTAFCDIAANENISLVDIIIEYDNGILSCNDSYVHSSDSIISITKVVNGERSVRIPISFTAKAEGSGSFILSGEITAGSNTFYVNNSYDYTVNGKEEEKEAASKGATAKNSSSSKSVYLTDLKVSGADLIPSFNENITSYIARVGYNIDKTTISATSGSGTTITGKGNVTLKVGDNKHTVTVKGGSKTKSYNINIYRMTKEETEIYERTKALENPLGVIIGEKTYIIDPDITNFGNFSGFYAEKTVRGDIEVNYLRDIAGKYRLYNLIDTNQKKRLFNLNDDGDFEEISYIIDKNNLYIVNPIPDNIDYEEDYTKKDVLINGIKVPALQSKQKSAKGIYIIYCYFNSEMGYYRYDSLEKSISRYPEFAEQYYKNSGKNRLKEGIVSAFNNLGKTGKIVIALIFITAIAVTISAVVIYLKAKKSKLKGEDDLTDKNSLLSEAEIIEQDSREYFEENTKQDDF